jgi:beta-glucosidase
VSLQSLHNVYLPPFKAAAESGAASFMCAFNELNGVPASAHPYLYDQLFNAWGYKGLVVSDWGSIGEMVAHGYSRNRKMAAQQALRAGVTIDMESSCYSDFLKQLVDEGELPEAMLNNAVRKVLVQKFQLGLFDNPYKYCVPNKEASEMLTAEHRRAARDVARKSIILLKNDGILPQKMPARIALIGALGNAKRDLDGSWTVATTSDTAVTLLSALRQRYPASTVAYVQGCALTGSDTSGFAPALAAARQADLVLLAVGEQWGMSGEARSRGDIHLPGVQEALATKIYQANSNTVTLLMAGRPMIFTEISKQAPAILYAWWLGSEAGNALLDVICGDHNPSARVPMSFPKHLGQIPVFYNRKNSGRPPVDAAGNYSNRYIDIDHKPQYPFGYGLSYTSFRYHNVSATPHNDGITLSLTLTNTGTADGHELVQVYVRKLWGESTRPVKELKAVENVFLKHGEQRTLSLLIPRSRLRYYGQSGWEDGSGDYSIFLGRNADEVVFEGAVRVE